MGKVALITGASRGIGKAIALKFASEGYDIAINYIGNQEEALEVQKECCQYGVQAMIHEGDVTDYDAMDQMTTEVFSRLCRMKKGRTLAKLVANTTLSQSDIKALQKVLAEKLQTAPETVACDCIAPMSCEQCENDSVMA